MDIASVVITIVLGGLSIWLALHLYSMSGRTEQAVLEHLIELRTISKSFQELSKGQFDTLLNAAVSPRPMDEVTRAMLEMLPSVTAQSNETAREYAALAHKATSEKTNISDEPMIQALSFLLVQVLQLSTVANSTLCRSALEKADRSEPTLWLIDESKKAFEGAARCLEGDALLAAPPDVQRAFRAFLSFRDRLLYRTDLPPVER